jgi:hypothetical protein
MTTNDAPRDVRVVQGIVRDGGQRYRAGALLRRNVCDPVYDDQGGDAPRAAQGHLLRPGEIGELLVAADAHGW